MKNLLVFVNPNKKFDKEHETLAKIQIDNSLELGWKKKDIILATNFPYKYRGVKSIHVPNKTFFAQRPNSTKFSVATYMLEKKMIRKGLYWLHDFDAYQLNEITEEELGLDNFDIGITNYGRMPTICGASLFFKNTATDIFQWVNNAMRQRNCLDEAALQLLLLSKRRNIRARTLLLNSTYNFMCFNVRRNYMQANKPLKVLHFHPAWNKLNFFMRGENKINTILMNERLIKIFNKHGIV